MINNNQSTNNLLIHFTDMEINLMSVNTCWRWLVQDSWDIVIVSTVLAVKLLPTEGSAG